MLKKTLVILGGTLLSVFFITPLQAYDVETHAFLTKAMIDFYNQQHPNKPLNSKFDNYLIDGARQEDNAPRWLNHFYDPVNNRGLHDGVYRGQASKEWAQSSSLQNKVVYRLASSGMASILSASQKETIKSLPKTDFTWQKAIDFYAHGQKGAAFYTLGHVIHLLEDAAVPDHTRNDAHPPYDEGGSPYETWTSQYNLENPDKSLNDRLMGKNSISLDNVGAYFDGMANYSNNNFYSKDSIKNYNLPKVDELNKEGIYNYKLGNIDNTKYHLAVVSTNKKYPWSTGPDNEITSIVDEGQDRILPDYWRLLSSKAVQHGAGLIDLFLKEAEVAKAKYELEKSRKPLLGQLADGFSNIFGRQEISIDSVIDAAKSPPISSSTPSPTLSLTPSPTSAKLSPTPSPAHTPSPHSPSSGPTATVSGSPAPDSTSSPQASPSTTPKIAVFTPTPIPTFPILSPAPSPSTTPLPTPTPQIIEQTSKPPIAWGPEGQAPAFSPTNSPSPHSPSSGPTATGSGSPAPSPSTTPIPSHLVISEIQVAGIDAGDEFIELYNPTSTSADISNWSMQYLAGTASTSENVSKKNFETNQSIPALGFFLIARTKNSGSTDGFRGSISPDLTHRTFSLSGTSAGGKIFLVNNQNKIEGLADTNIVDALDYSFNVPSANQSLERLAKVDESCFTAQGEGEYLGNGCDTDQDNNFAWRVSPHPQNSQSLPEPRSVASPSNFTATFDSAALEIALDWNQPVGSSLAYNLYSVNSPRTKMATVSVPPHKLKIDQVGRNYNFEIETVDRDGLTSDTKAVSLAMPSFLSSINFYQNALSKYFLRLAWNQYPFVSTILNHLASGQPAPHNWHTVIFYHNTTASKTNDIFWSASNNPPHNSWGLTAPNGLSLKYANCQGTITPGAAIIFPDTAKQCSGIAGNYSSLAFDFAKLASNSLLVETTPGQIASNDFITAAFYAFQPGYEPNHQAIRFLAADQTKYYLEKRP